MAESATHMTYVRKIVDYITQTDERITSGLVETDLPEYQFRPSRVVDGYIPDVYARTQHAVYLGEAKTMGDVDNRHTRDQIMAYLKELRLYEGDVEPHLVLCTSLLSFVTLKNIAKQAKLSLSSDCMIHVLNDCGREDII